MTLKHEARRYVSNVFAVLEAASAGYADTPAPMPEWQRIGDGVFALRPRLLKSYETCLLNELAQRPFDSERLDAAIRADMRLAPLVDRMIGTPSGSGFRVDEALLRRSLLFDVARATEGLVYDERCFDTGYNGWLKTHAARQSDVTMVAPLQEMTLSGGPIRLAKGVVIDQLTDHEIAGALQMRVVRDLYGPTDMAFLSSRVGIRCFWQVPRGDFERFTEAERKRDQELSTSMKGVALRVLDALRLFKPGRVAIEGFVTFRDQGTLLGGADQAATRRSGDSLHLSARDASAFQAFWRRFERAHKRAPAVAAAIRRFSYASERTRRDDEIVDLVASLEGLLLAGIEDRAELGYRTRLRGAVFVDGSGFSRRQVQKQLGRAYSVRSSVAHGDTPKTRDLKSANDERVTLDAFVDSTEELVRLALRKAVESVARGAEWPPDWDGLILGPSHAGRRAHRSLLLRIDGKGPA